MKPKKSASLLLADVVVASALSGCEQNAHRTTTEEYPSVCICGTGLCSKSFTHGWKRCRASLPNTFCGFEYEAIAITYNLVEALKISAFGGKAGTFAILPDGRVVVDNGSEELSNIHNFFAMIEKSKNIADDNIDLLQKDFLEGNSGQMVFDINGTNYYLVYEPANFQNWVVLGIGHTDVVNSSMNRLQSTTIAVVSAIIIALAVCLLFIVIQQNRQKLKLKDKELFAPIPLFLKPCAVRR